MEINILTSGLNNITLMGCDLKEQKPATPTNIICLLAEDISNDLECYGMPAANNPVLPQLVENYWKCTHWYVPNPICFTARSALMTGMHQLKINAHHHRSNLNVTL